MGASAAARASHCGRVVATSTWSTGETSDLEKELGAGWLFGAYKAEEVNWVAAAYVAAASG